jgi:1,4-alpha-glucan branching enzyme
LLAAAVWCSGGKEASAARFLFDASKAEMAGDADWIIDADLHNLGVDASSGSGIPGAGTESNPQPIPTPVASGITAGTAETYWQGALSAWAVDLVKCGHSVETLPYDGRITYQDSTNPRDLTNYGVFVLVEPNILLTASEKAAIVNFVANGGGLFLVSDHLGSDRNNDGAGSVQVLNDLMTNSVGNNPFGILFNSDNLAVTSSQVDTTPGNPVTYGLAGTGTSLAYSGGATITLNTNWNASVRAAIWSSASRNSNNVMLAYATYGAGRVVAVGDSSPFDDGTGDPHDTLFNGYGEATDKVFILNASFWLLPRSPGQSIRPGWGSTPYRDSLGTGVTFRVWAPNATSVYVPGQFNGWSTTATPLIKEVGTNGIWSADVPGTTLVGQQYKFNLNFGPTNLWRHDPRSRLVTTSGSAAGANDIIYDRAAFNWTGDNFTPPALSDLVIYELHAGTFPLGSSPSKFLAATNHLDHLVQLGVNAVELMPVAEFPGTDSWGYNPAQPFAVENAAYGGPDGLKAFVKACHARGIAVLLDIVHNHYGPDDLDLWNFDGWTGTNTGGGIYFFQDSLRATTPWGPRPNYTRQGVGDYILDNCKMWLEECRVDGFRWDALRELIATGPAWSPTYSLDAMHLVSRVNEMMAAGYPGKIRIAESCAELATLGFDSTWDMTFPYVLKTELARASDGSRDINAISNAIVTRVTNPDLGLSQPASFLRVNYAESHDTAGDLNGGARLPTAIDPAAPTGYAARKRSMLGAAIAFTAPGVPLILQGQEMLETNQFGSTRPINWTRTNTFNAVVSFYRDLIRLRRNLDGVSAGLQGEEVEVFKMDNASKLIAFRRWHSAAPNDDVIVVANFAGTTQPAYPMTFPRAGCWFVHLNSDSTNYGGDFGDTGSGVITAIGSPASANLAIGPYTVLVLSQSQGAHPPVGIAQQPQNVTTTNNYPAGFTVVATGDSPLVYQWRKNGVNIPGANSSGYSIASAQAGDAAAYTVVVTNCYSSMTSAVAMLTVKSAANYVYHERTANDVTGGAANNCGGAQPYVPVPNPTSAQSYLLRFKVEFQSATDQLRVYYTTDGSAPAGSFGAPGGTSQVVSGAYECTFTSMPSTVDVCNAAIPAQPAGTVVRYIVSAWHSSGGPEVFANSGTCGGCGNCQSSACASVFQYTVASTTDLYWDANGSAAGAGGLTPSGTWGENNFWSSTFDGTSATSNWSPGQRAVFSAGSDATGSYTVLVNGTQTAGSMNIEEGTVLIVGGAVALGTGNLTLNSGATLITTNSASITASPGATLTLNGGTLRAANPGVAGTFIDQDFVITLGPSGGTFSQAMAGVLNIVQTGTTINGPGNLTKDGGGVLAIAGTCNYGGSTVITDGEIRIRSSPNRLPITTAVTVTSPGILNLNGVAQRIGSLSGNGTVGIAGAASQTLTVGDTTSCAFGGLIADLANAGAGGGTAGTGRLAKTGAGTLSLTGANTYSGGTIITNGTLLVSNTTGSATGPGPITVLAAGTLSGPGSVAGAVTNYGTLSPGASPGSLTTSNQAWAGGGSYLWEINDAAAGAGTNPGWDHLAINGTLTISATPGNPFTIAVRSLTLGSVSGPAANFSSTLDYSWPIATASNGFVGFDPAAFAINTTEFVNPTGNGTWLVATNRDTLELRLVHPLTITLQPQSVLARCGSGMAAFNVVADGGSSLGYQWRLEGADIPGATNSEYTVNPTTLATAGGYDVVITNLSGAVTSVVATLTLTNQTPTVANADAFSAFRNLALTIPASFVLSNDVAGSCNGLNSNLTVISVSAVSSNGGSVSFRPGGEALWTNRYGLGDDVYPNVNDSVYALVVDPRGKVVVAGVSVYGPGSPVYDHVKVAYDFSGEPLWTNHFGPPNYLSYGLSGELLPSPNIVAVGSDGVVLSAGFSGFELPYAQYNYMTVALSSNGVPLWTNRYGTTLGYDLGRVATISPSGTKFVSGESPVGAGQIATVAYSASGAALWTNLLGESSSPVGIARGGNGLIYVTGISAFGGGAVTVAYSEQGVPQWTNRFGNLGPVGMAVDSQGNVFVAGDASTSQESVGYQTIAYSGAGQHLWTTTFGDFAERAGRAARSITVDAAGRVIVTGQMNGQHFATVAYSSDGQGIWTNQHAHHIASGQISATAQGVVTGPDGNVFVTGYTLSEASRLHFETIAYNRWGAPLWTNHFGGSFGNDYAQAIGIDERGDIYVAGHSVSANGDTDFVTIKYSGGSLSYVPPTNFTGPDSFTYVVRDSLGLSSTGTVTVTVLIGEPQITQQPQSLTNNAGSNVTFSVTAIGEEPLSYQWRKDGSPIYLSETNTLTLTGLHAWDAGGYDVVVTNAFGSVTSSVATLTVICPNITVSGTPPPSLLVGQNVMNYSFTAFSDAGPGNLTLFASGLPPGLLPGMQSGNTLPINGSPSAPGTYVFTVTALDMMTGCSGSQVYTQVVECPAFTLDPLVLPDASPTNSYDQTLTVSYFGQMSGDTILYDVVSGSLPSGIALSNDGHLTGAPTNGPAGNYNFIVGATNQNGCFGTQAYTLTVTGQPVITQEPSSAFAQCGTGAATFSLTATGFGELSYQWRFNDAPIPGATGTNCTVNPTTLTNAGNYTVVVTNLYGAITSSIATLTLTNQTPTMANADALNAYRNLALTIYPLTLTSNDVPGSCNGYNTNLTIIYVSPTSANAGSVEFFPSGQPLWTNSYDGPGSGEDRAWALAVDVSGIVYVCGVSSSNFNGRSFATIAYSNTGFPLWTNRYAGPGDNGEPLALAADGNGNVFVTGISWGDGTYYDWATVAYDQNGLALWTNQFIGPNGYGNDWPYDLAVDAIGNVYVTGFSEGTNGAYDCLTLAYSGLGVPLWTNRYTGPESTHSSGQAVAVDANGQVYVTGSTAGNYLTLAYSSTGQPLWTNQYRGPVNGGASASAIALDRVGQVYVTGSSSGSNSASDFATIAYSNEGHPLWTNRYNGPAHGNDEARRIAVGQDGNVFVTGYSDGGSGSGFIDYATVAYSRTGVGLWTNRYDGPAHDNDYGRAVAVGGNGTVYVTGASTLSNSVGSSLTIAYSETGVPVWTNRYVVPAGGSSWADALALDQSGNVFITGTHVDGGSGNYDFATLKYSGGNVVYTPPTNFTGTDSFTYVVQDSLGLTATGTVTVTVNPLPPPTISQPPSLVDGDFVAHFSGVPNAAYVIEVLTDFTAGWHFHAEVTASPSGEIVFSTPFAAVPMRFFRAIPAP